VSIAAALASRDAGTREVAAMPGPGLHGHADPVSENAACERCHVEIAAEWRSSLHHLSDTDPVYRRALAIEPLGFCRGCHAPEADPAGPAPAPLSRLGTGCVTCHVPGQAVLAALTGSKGAKAPSPHPVQREAAFGADGACAGCHEFAFPHRPERQARLLMQSTVSEHRASPLADASCASCHMPDAGPAGRRHRSHVFTGARDAELVKRAVRVTAERRGTVARIRIEAVGVGHAFPTGDLFRRLEVSAEAIGADQQVDAEATRHLARHFAVGKGTQIRVLASDDRVSPGAPASVDLELGPGAKGREIVWRVAYQRVEHPITAGEEGAAVVEGEVEIAAGKL
jgi:hypothetical protein